MIVLLGSEKKKEALKKNKLNIHQIYWDYWKIEKYTEVFEGETLEKEKYSKPIFAMRNATKRRRIQKGHAPRPAGQQHPPLCACL